MPSRYGTFTGCSVDGSGKTEMTAFDEYESGLEINLSGVEASFWQRSRVPAF